MIYLRARFYEPEMNRFAQKDLLRGSAFAPKSLNRYVYVQNDPMNLIDPSGMSIRDWGKNLINGAKNLWNTVSTGVKELVDIGKTMYYTLADRPDPRKPENKPVDAISGAAPPVKKTAPIPTPAPTPASTPASIPSPEPGPAPVLPRNTAEANNSASRNTISDRGCTYNKPPTSIPSVDNVTAAGACVLINKKVDNVGSILGTQHTSALFQNADGDWYFFFWGDTVVFEKIDDNSALNSMDSLNSYLYDHGLYGNANKPYISSVYIPGDFSNSIDEASRLLDVYEQSKRDAFMANPDYNLITSNCTQVTMRLVELGLLPDGTTVGEYMDSNNIYISVWPTRNMKATQQLFGNTAMNYNDYLTQTGSD